MVALQRESLAALATMLTVFAGVAAAQPFSGVPVNPGGRAFPPGGGGAPNLRPDIAQKLAQGHVYNSQRWRAAFHYEPRLQIPGSDVFPAGRVVALQPDSPLNRLGIRVGDVITRLDGTRVNQGVWPNQDGCYWMMPEFERHFGVVQVRFIRTGTAVVEEQPIDIGPRCRPPRRPNPLSP